MILGMHRSGTSAYAGVLNKLGITLGSRLMETAEDNERGFFENLDIYEVNEGILESLNSSWDDLFILEKDWWKQPSLDTFRDKIIEIVEREFCDKVLFGIKDPRLSLLFPLWSSVFEQLAIETVCIIPIRHPLEVADSLTKRNGFSIEKGTFLWMKHMLYAEYYSRPYRRVFISLNDLLKDPERTLDRISRALDVRYPKTWRDAQRDIKAFLDPRIKHHTRLDDSFGDGLSSLIKDYYLILLQFSGIDAPDSEKLTEIDRIRTEYIDNHTLFYDRGIRDIDDVAATVPDNSDQREIEDIQLHERNGGGIRMRSIFTGSSERIGGPEKVVPGMVTVIVVNYNGRNYQYRLCRYFGSICSR
jgi:hypothetical protein